MHFKHKMAMAVTVAFAAMAASPAIHAAPHAQPAAGHHATQGLQAPHGGGYCDPFADWDWEYYKDKPLIGDSAGAPRAPSGWIASGRASAPGAAARVIGTTPAAIEHNFVGVVTRNLANAGTAGRIARLSDRELDGIARHAARGAPVDRAALLKLFATRLDGPSLVRVARAFGRAPVEAAVRTYADPATRTAFALGIAGLVPSPPEGGGGGGTTPYPSPSPPRPTVDMTIEEIYLEFRTAPVGSLSPAGALAETAQFVGMRLSAAGWAGSAIGTGISWLIQHYAPDLDNAIGATIATMIDNFWSATNEMQQGHYEAAFDDLFGFPVTWSSNPWGDWDITTPMVSYYQSSGSCGW